MTRVEDVRWPFRPWVCVERGGRAESYHAGILVVVDDESTVRASWGDPQWPSYLRSSLKMIQALPLVESGAADAFGLTPRELAIACASHRGAAAHVEAAARILQCAGLGPEHLLCGAHAPYDRKSRQDLVRRGESPSPLHNNCSGKHAGMLATCAHRGWDLASYQRADHPLQREIATALATLAGLEEPLEHAVDGCGVPTFRIPLVRFGIALARFVSGRGPGGAHHQAACRLFDAMHQHPDMISGKGGFCTEVAQAANRPILAKGGAEGMYGVAWREDAGRGVALVAKDAAGESRGRDFAVVEAMRQLGLLDARGLERMSSFHSAPLRNHAGTEVGRLVAMFDFGEGSASGRR
jgi:L-asparaginase II